MKETIIIISATNKKSTYCIVEMMPSINYFIDPET